MYLTLNIACLKLVKYLKRSSSVTGYVPLASEAGRRRRREVWSDLAQLVSLGPLLVGRNDGNPKTYVPIGTKVRPLN